jgi:hypothetical protein
MIDGVLVRLLQRLLSFFHLISSSNSYGRDFLVMASMIVSQTLQDTTCLCTSPLNVTLLFVPRTCSNGLFQNADYAH